MSAPISLDESLPDDAVAHAPGSVPDAVDSSSAQPPLMSASEQERLRTLIEVRSATIHDLRNVHQPMLCAAASLEFLLTQFADDLPRMFCEEIAHDIQTLKVASQHLAEVHRADTLRPVADEVSRQPLSMPELMSFAAHILRGLGSPSVPVTVHSDSDAVVVVNRTDMARVLSNLVRNSVEAIRESRGSGRVWVEATDEPGGVLISVGDDGPGLPSGVEIFKPWVSTRSSRGGSGLGLGTVWRLVRANGGEISAECPPGGGTVMRIHFPAVERSE